MPRDLEQAHDERALEHGPRRLLDAPARRRPDAASPAETRGGPAHPAEALTRGEDDDAVARDERELDERQRDRVAEPGVPMSAGARECGSAGSVPREDALARI